MSFRRYRCRPYESLESRNLIPHLHQTGDQEIAEATFVDDVGSAAAAV